MLDRRAGDVASRLYMRMGYIESSRALRDGRSSNGELYATVFLHKELDGGET